MRNVRWVRTVILALVWAYAAAVWASIAHHLLGMPDLGVVAPLVAATAAGAWSLRPKRDPGASTAAPLVESAGQAE